MTDEERARERWFELVPKPCFLYPDDATPLDVFEMLLDEALIRESFLEDLNYANKNEIRDLKNALIEATLTIKKLKGF